MLFYIISGIQDIRIGQFEELLREGFVCSYNFKTVGKFIQQPITTSSVVTSILSVYVNTIRPAIRSKYKKRHSDMDNLFLSYDGRHNVRLGRLITQYFMSYSLHITSTTIRSLVETEANILKKRGDISATDFSSLQNIGGHSEKTSEEYYIKERTCDDINAGKRIFDQLELNRNRSLESGIELETSCDIEHFVERSTPEPPSQDQQRLLSASNHSAVLPPQIIYRGQSVQSPAFSFFPSTTDSSSIVWGRQHPNFNQPNRIRAAWSEAELKFLGQVISEFSDER